MKPIVNLPPGWRAHRRGVAGEHEALPANISADKPGWFMESFEFYAEESVKALSNKDRPKEPKKEAGLMDALQGMATALAPWLLLRRIMEQR